MEKRKYSPPTITFEGVAYTVKQPSAEKQVFRLPHSRLVVAAKIFNERDSDNQPQDRTALALAEAAATKRIRESELREYTPDVVGFIQHPRDGIVGVQTEWMEDARLLCEYEGERPLTVIEVLRLYGSLLNVSEEGIYPMLDMMHDRNLMLVPSMQPRLKFAECGLVEVTDLAGYQSAIKTSMDDLMNRYTRRGPTSVRRRKPVI